MSYDSGFNFIKVRQTVYKWWYLVYKPVYVLTHHGVWPAEQEAKRVEKTTPPSPAVSPEREELARQMAAQIQAQGTQSKVDVTVLETPVAKPAEVAPDTSNDVLDRANEIMERLAKEAAEDEAKKQAEIEAAKKAAAEADAKRQAELSQADNASNDALDRANEIMERLAREAAEDEAKKQAEIEAAKKTAAEAAKVASIMAANQVDISSFIEEGKEQQNASDNNITL